MVFAHERWSELREFPSDWDFAFEGLTLALLPLPGHGPGGRPGRHPARRRDGRRRHLLATGWHAREGAALLVLAGPLGLLELGCGRCCRGSTCWGSRSTGSSPAGALVGRCGARARARAGTRRPRAAVWALKVAAGVALIIVAFDEKLAMPDLALAFPQDHPELNVAREIGLGWSDLEFVRVAAAIEVLFGLLLIAGALPQDSGARHRRPHNDLSWPARPRRS